MSEPWSLLTGLSEEAIWRLEEACCRFEKAWQAAQRPRLEDFLTGWDGKERLALLRELLRLEVHYRKQGGETPSAADYQTRFPDAITVLDEVFGTAPGADQSQGQDTVDEGPAEGNGPTPVPEVTAASCRYRKVRYHAGGGLGDVFVAEDAELHRDVALKEIKPDRAGRPDYRGRFVLEAEVTGRLEHPGIVPVYGLGLYADGRPYYAMRFIKGETMTTAITRFHGEKPARFASLAFRSLLSRFVTMCQAVAYAHSRGVLHRDLKPDNVMLGPYGETLVLDWGLAKVIGRAEKGDAGPASAESSLQPGEGAAETAAGAVVGTPAFLSPEQAGSRTEELGPASDIYGLGATLYVMLTGRLAFAGSPSAVLRQVKQGELVPPRQVNSEVPAALQAICLKAMSPTPKGRYSTAQELAADVEHWLADEPVSAWPEPVTVKLGRWVRRNKALVSSAAAAALVALIATGVGAFWYQAELARQDHEQAKRDAEEAVQQAKIAAQREFLHKEVTAALDQSEALHQKLHKQLGDPLTVHELLSDIDGWERQVQAARQAWQQAQKLADSNAELLDPVVLDRLRQLHTTLGADKDDYDLARKLDDIRLEAATLVDGKFNPYAAGPKYAEALAEAGYHMEQKSVADKIRKTPLRYALVAALDDWAALTLDVNLRSQLLAVAREADPDEWRDQFRDAKVWNDAGALKQLADQVDPAKQSPQILSALALLMYVTKGQAAPLLRQALLHYPKDFWLHFDLGTFSANPDERIGCFQAALAIRPKSAAAHNNWGNVLVSKKDYDGAIGHYEKALAIDPKYVHAHYNWANALMDKKDYDGAIGHYDKALAIDRNHAKAHTNWGYALVRKKDYDGAIGHYKKALAIDPNDAMAHTNWGVALARKKDYDGAIAHYQKALAIDPNLAEAHNNWGSALTAQKDYDGAIGHYEKALAIDPNYAAAHYNWGNALSAQKDYDGAIGHYDKALAIDPNYADAHISWGNVLVRKKDYDGAIGHYDKALAIDPNYAGAHYNWGSALARKKVYDGAISHYQKALALEPDYAKAHCNLAHCLGYEGNFVDALKELQLGHALGSKQPDWPYPSAQWVKTAEQAIALDQKRADILAGKTQPQDVAEKIALAEMCRLQKKHYATAAKFYTDAFADNASLALIHRYNAARAAAQAGTGQGKDAADLSAKDKAELLQQALDWLRADLAGWKQQAQSAQPAPILKVVSVLERWQSDPDLAGVRDKKALAQLPKEAQADWQKIWSDVDEVLKHARACFTEVENKQGTLTFTDGARGHVVKLKAGVTYVIGLHSKQFDTLLRLENAQGQVLAQNSDVKPTADSNSRLIFVPPQDCDYKLIATRVYPHGTGAYTLTIRSFQAKKQ
jgi:serine/threonine-protein kinase